jgi:hypothetical protein
MSRGGRIALGIFGVVMTLFCGVMSAFGFSLGEGQELWVWAMLVFGLLGAAMAAACFFPRSRPVSLRIIGGILFAGCAAGLLLQIRETKEVGWTRRTGRAFAMATFGCVGGLYLTVLGDYPLWGLWSGAFKPKPDDE